MFTEKKIPDEYYPSGYFPRTGAMGDSVSPRMNTIASRDQFKTNKNQRKFSGEL